MSKTLVDIDDKALARLMELTGEDTKKAAVNGALRDKVRRLEFGRYLDFMAGPAGDGLRDPDVIAAAQR
ncbi:MAG: type II toxin-antitoxin system VapB family antitoxin [Propionibacteriaceae bacterium]|nr:type II toxin-antitoxin system VapB family antitoxin [Propionibacteriaceae bacterium]